jgi:hypothetical protein
MRRTILGKKNSVLWLLTRGRAAAFAQRTQERAAWAARRGAWAVRRASWAAAALAREPATGPSAAGDAHGLVARLGCLRAGSWASTAGPLARGGGRGAGAMGARAVGRGAVGRAAGEGVARWAGAHAGPRGSSGAVGRAGGKEGEGGTAGPAEVGQGGGLG